MKKNLIKKDEKWEYVVEQIRATITEAVHNSRWMLIEGYWNVGKLLREEFGDKDLTKTLTALSAEVNLSQRTLWRALACYDKYPDIQQIPEGKSITWNRLITKYLTTPKEEDISNDWRYITCRISEKKKTIYLRKKYDRYKIKYS